jgi:hypothetical protein
MCLNFGACQFADLAPATYNFSFRLPLKFLLCRTLALRERV